MKTIQVIESDGVLPKFIKSPAKASSCPRQTFHLRQTARPVGPSFWELLLKSIPIGGLVTVPFHLYHRSSIYDQFTKDFFSPNADGNVLVTQEQRQEAITLCRQASKLAALETMQ
jgi:hypothetical protein